MGQIYKVDFGDSDNVKPISELFDSIQFYRQEGRSLSEIHAAYRQSGLWNKSRSSFSNEYYQYRKQQKVSASDSNSKQSKNKTHVKNQGSTKPTIDDSNNGNSVANSQTDSRTGIRPDMTLAEKREISAELFRQKRNRGIS